MGGNVEHGGEEKLCWRDYWKDRSGSDLIFVIENGHFAKEGICEESGGIQIIST
jgi:hypothetical protein